MRSGEMQIRYGRFKLGRDQWQAIGDAIANNGDKLVRDILTSEMLPNLSRRFPEFKDDCHRLGWLDGLERLTDAGIEHFSQFSPTLQARIVSRPGRAGDDDDGLHDAAQGWLEHGQR
jgi:hypothetical protein